MARPRTPIGTFGEIRFDQQGNGRVRALARFRDHDGRLRRVTAMGETQKAAERNLKEVLSDRIEQSTGAGELTASSSFRQLVEIWLDDLDLENKLAESTRALYERNMRQLVMPAFENYTLREISVRKVDQFVKTLAATKSYSTAKQARTVLSLSFGLAVRYDALRENPVRDIARMHKPPSQAMALTLTQVDAIRAAVRGWRRGGGLSGPKPDGQLEQIIEVMLGTSARIGRNLRSDAPHLHTLRRALQSRGDHQPHHQPQQHRRRNQQRPSASHRPRHRPRRLVINGPTSQRWSRRHPTTSSSANPACRTPNRSAQRRATPTDVAGRASQRRCAPGTTTTVSRPAAHQRNGRDHVE